DRQRTLLVRQREVQLVQRVVGQRLAGDQQQAGLGQVADPAHHPLGHRVGHHDGVGGLAALGAPEFLVHACASVPSSPRSPSPAKLRKACIAACQARSTRRAWPLVTIRACPEASSRATLSSDCSPMRWPRWLTNRALPVSRLYQESRRRTVSPCWLVVNSIQVPNGST